MADSSNTSRGTWVGIEPVHWAFRQAPCPPELVVTLAAIATYAGNDGKSAFPSVATIASDTGKSGDQVSRDIRRLRDAGLLLLGDQSISMRKWPVGSRPVVYDLPLDLIGPKPSRASKNKSGRRSPVADDPSGMDAPPLHGSTPPASMQDPLPHGSRTPSCMDAAPPPASMQDKEALKNPHQSSSNRPGPEPDPARAQEGAAEGAPRGAEADDDDDDEEMIGKRTNPNGRSVDALIDSASARRRHLRVVGPTYRRTTSAPTCGEPFCTYGALMSPEDPKGTVRCPSCWEVVEPGLESAA